MLAIAAALVALGYWTYGAVEGSLREIRAVTLRALVQTHAEALRATLEERLEGVGEAARRARRVVLQAVVRWHAQLKCTVSTGRSTPRKIIDECRLLALD